MKGVSNGVNYQQRFKLSAMALLPATALPLSSATSSTLAAVVTGLGLPRDNGIRVRGSRNLAETGPG